MYRKLAVLTVLFVLTGLGAGFERVVICEEAYSEG